MELLKESITVMTDSSPSGSGAVRTSVFTLSNIGLSTVGQYQCRATVTTTHSSLMDSTPGVSNSATVTFCSKFLFALYTNCIFSHSFCLSPVPQPSVSLFNPSAVLVGSTANLTCAVILQQYSSYSSIPITVNVELLKGSMTVMTDSSPSGSGAVRTSVFTLSNIGVSTAGHYQCRATVNTTHNNVIDSTPGVSNNATLTVQSKKHSFLLICSWIMFISTVPIPSVTLSDSVAVLGSPATLQCTVMLHSSLTCSGPIAVTVDLIRIGTNTIITTQLAEGPSSICNTTFTVSANASNSDGGQYQCRIYTAADSELISLPAQIAVTATLYVVGE